MTRWIRLCALFAAGGAIYGIGQHEHAMWVAGLGAAVQVIAFARALGMPPVPGSDFE